MPNNFGARLLLGVALLCIQAGSLSVAQSFEDPENAAESGQQNAEGTLESQLDDSLEDSLQESLPTESASGEENEFDTFIPSEDISEDFSVPFPVDI